LHGYINCIPKGFNFSKFAFVLNFIIFNTHSHLLRILDVYKKHNNFSILRLQIITPTKNWDINLYSFQKKRYTFGGGRLKNGFFSS